MISINHLLVVFSNLMDEAMYITKILKHFIFNHTLKMGVLVLIKSVSCQSYTNQIGVLLVCHIIMT